MKTERNRFQLRLDQETGDMIRMLHAQDNCSSMNEFIEKAIKFYISYITTNQHTEFLNPVLSSTIDAGLKQTENRTANNLFRLTVEMSMMMNILARGLEVSDESLRVLRSRCTNAIKNTKGQVNIDDIVKVNRDG